MMMLHLVFCTHFNSSSIRPLLLLHVFILLLYVMLQFPFFIGVGEPHWAFVKSASYFVLIYIVHQTPTCS